MGIGIDFGTTNSAAIFSRDDGNLVLGVRDRGGGNQLPKPDSSSVWVRNDGVACHSVQPAMPANYSLIRKLKWFLGNKPEIAIGGRCHDAIALSTGYMKCIRDQLAGSVGPEIDAPGTVAVASVPNKSWPGYRKNLRRCLTEAGFHSVRLVYEPTAAAVACLHEVGALHNPANVAGPVLVMDWGGGTVDVSVLELKSNRTLVDINTAGVESGLGGGDMDEWLANEAARRGGMEREWEQLLSAERNDLLDRIERYKIRCFDHFDNNQSLIDEMFLVPNAGGRTITLTSDLVRECVDHFSQKVQDTALRATRAAGLASDDVRYKILVGGPFQSRFVRDNRCFQTWANARTLSSRHGAQLATAAGCALLARQHGHGLKLGCDIGVLEADDGFFTVAHRHESIPHGVPTSSHVLRRHQFDLTDLTCSNAIFEFARRSGRAEQMQVVPMGSVQVPVSHVAFGGVIPFSPTIERASLDNNLNFSVEIRGQLGQVNNCRPEEIMARRVFDCLPLELELPQWFIPTP